MAAGEKELIDAARKLSDNYSNLLPEGVLFGFAKLIAMDHDSLEVLLPAESLKLLDIIYEFFKKREIDISLLKQYFILPASTAVKKKECSKKLDEFFRSLNNYSLRSVLYMAFKYSVIPLKELFSVSSSANRILEYQSKLREEIASEESDGQNAVSEGNDTKKETKEETNNAAKEIKSGLTKSIEDEIKSEFINSAGDTGTDDRFSPLRTKYKKLRNDLLPVVQGQEQAIVKFIQGYNQGELLDTVEERNTPKSYFFFFGPPGTGKTLLANTAAKSLGIPYRLFNMSGYINYDSMAELIGIGKQYKNSVPGRLTGFVEKNPECILIFDEFEKAHINIIRLFLQILGAGNLRDNCLEKTVDFSKTIIIFTSNAGRSLYEGAGVKPSSLPHKVLISALEEELPPEICSRIGAGNVIMFNHLGIRKLAHLAEGGFDEIAENMRKAYEVDITFSDKIPMLFLLQYGSGADARIAGSQSKIFLKNEIYDLINQDFSFKDVSNIHFDVDWSDAAEEIQALFNKTTASELLIFCGEDLRRYFDKTTKVYDEKITVHYAGSYAEAKALLEKPITAVFIDPLFMTKGDNSRIINVFDYITESNMFFHELIDMKTDMPVFILENRDKRIFTEAEKTLFLQEGASDIVYAQSDGYESFSRKIIQITEELYMDSQHESFSGKGFALDYKTKQKVSGSGRIEILFYELRKIAAIEAENREMVLSAAEKPDVTFSDVIGAENAKDELRYFIDYLKNPKSYVLSGRKPPKGVLLFGPPGTGKTMLAKAMAGESEVAFLQTSASEFKNKYVGESEANIRRIFDTAKKYAPAIIFIDEIDAIGKKRTGSDTARHDESMLNALLTEMDGFDPPDLKRPVFVLAATNFGIRGRGGSVSAELDPALMRRFDNKIYVDLPNKDERKAYIKMITGKEKGFFNIKEETIENVADRTTGQSLAILQNVIDLAVRNAQKKGVTADDGILLNALEEYMYGEQRNHTPDYYHEVAVHEAGHAYVSYKCGEKPSYITIESRGDFGGYMQKQSSEDVPNYTKEELLGKIRTALAGRASEMVFFGEERALNTGASSDLERATGLAFDIAGRYGMAAGEMAVLSKKDMLGSVLAKDYVASVNALLKQEMDNAVRVIEEGKEVVAAVAEELEKENHMTGKQFENIVNKF